MKHIGLFLALCCVACSAGPDTIDHYSRLAVENYGSGSTAGLTISVDLPWRLECGGSCIHYQRSLIEVARGPCWRQELMHEVTHWLLFQDGYPAGTHHPIMYGRGLCYGACSDMPTVNPAPSRLCR
jgi:hypothetical protein